MIVMGLKYLKMIKICIYKIEMVLLETIFFGDLLKFSHCRRVKIKRYCEILLQDVFFGCQSLGAFNY